MLALLRVCPGLCYGLHMTDKELADYLSEALRQFDQLAERTPKDATLQKLVDEASEPLGCLIGYLIG